jgi:hypothetical protein
VEIHSLATIIQPCEFPTKTEYAVINPMGTNSLAAANATLAGNMMLHDLGKKKFEQAKELTKEINASNAEAIGAMMAKDMGKKKMEEARELEKQQNQQQSAAAANVFAGELANKRLDEAKAVGESAKVSQKEEAVALFSKGAIKKQFKEALATKNIRQIEFLAATMLKNAWRGKKARKHVNELKLKKQKLMEEGMARKLQSKYRTRLASRKVAKLRAEKQRLREEGCAIIVQSNWRIKKSRDKVKKLKEQRQKLMEEGAALKLQSCWRMRQANAKVSQLRQEADRKNKRKMWAQGKILSQLKKLRARIVYRKLVMKQKQIFIVSLRSATDINIGDVNSSDPYVLLHVEQPSQSQKVSISPVSPKSSPLKDSHTPASASTVSLFRSKVIYSTLNPNWDEQIFAVNADGYDSLVFTLMDKDNFTSDDFLGQVTEFNFHFV